MTLNKDQFIQKARKIHGDKYDYSITEYASYKKSISFICPIHGICTHLAKTHLEGRGCYKCGQGVLSETDFINKSKIIHKEKYDYSQLGYKDTRKKVKIICKTHGAFQQQPQKHMAGQGCPKCNRSPICGSGKTTQEQFLSMATNIHKDRYDYSQTRFINWKTKIKIMCRKHGEFTQDPSRHIHGKNGCPHCGFNTSFAANEWLDSFKNLNMIRERVMFINNRRFKVDGYDPASNTIYEYFGSYWHGHPTRFNPDDIHPILKITYKKLYEQTLSKIKHIQDNGYNIIYQWGR